MQSPTIDLLTDRSYYNKWQRASSSATPTANETRRQSNQHGKLVCERRPSNLTLNLQRQKDEDSNNGATSDGSKAPPVTPTLEFYNELQNH
jgi:hypothetical protein